MKKPPFIENHIYHIYNRGVEKRDIFLDDKDYLLFIHDLFEFNDKNPVVHLSPSSSLSVSQSQYGEVEPLHIEGIER